MHIKSYGRARSIIRFLHLEATLYILLHTIHKRKMKLIRFYIVIVFISFFALPSHAVLQEDSLKNSLAVLRHELISYHYQLNERLNETKLMNSRITEQIQGITQNSAQISLMLYSQKAENVFDLTYACHQATELYKSFEEKTRPFHSLIEQSNQDIARYDSLINALSTMYTTGMNQQEMTDRNVCLTLAVSIKRMLIENNQNFQEFIQYYKYSHQQLKALNDYAQKRYQVIQSDIFEDSGENYFRFLSHIRYYIMQMSTAITEKYVPQQKVRSQWDARWIYLLLSMVLFYGLLAVLVNYLSIKYLLPHLFKLEKFKKRRETILSKRTCIIMNGSVITFGIALLLIRFTASSNFVYMTTGLLLEFTWLLAVILGSLYLRVNAEQLQSTYRIYYPIAFMAFVVIAFRIVLIPNVFVNFLLPPLLLLCTLWQARVLKKRKQSIMKYDMYLGYITLLVFVFSTITSWFGYTLLSVLLIIWWMIQQACILTIACVHDYLAHYREVHHLKEKPVNKVWMFRLLYFVLLPSAMTISFIISIYWAADVFNLSELTWKIYITYLIDTDNFKLSIFAVTLVVVLWYIFNYVNHTAKAIIRLILQQRDPTTAASRGIMVINVVQIIIWGTWLMIALALFKVNNTWLVVVSGGLSTGIGFAMKDILENIYYGVSLMAGRIKIGDYIVCDGIRGKVSSISYTSTMLEATDGSVIAFQNSQLFTKNYKNMTKNHGYELDILEVGVAYGTNIKECQRLLIDAIMKLPCIYKKKGVKVVLKSFDDSAITLKVLVWVNVLTQYGDDGTVMECIYQTLTDNHIEIPFPQREVKILNQIASENEKGK